jgi:cytoskeleton protein RodZ
MSEAELPIHFADTAQGELDAAKSAGQMLREAREAHGLHVAALAVSLKVPVKKLEALEADRLEELPDAVFVRGLASSVCRALKVDAAPILAKLPQLTRALDHGGSDVNVAFRTRADGPAPSALSQLNRPVMFGVLALLLAALVLMLLPDFSSRTASTAAISQGTSNPSSSADSGANGAVSMGSGVNLSATQIAGASETATGVISTSSLLANESSTLPTLSVTPALSTPTVASPTLVLSPAAAAAAVPLPADSIVVFTATGETWVEVRDAGGKIVLQRTLQAGEKAGAGAALGRLPYSIVVGRANLTQVTVRDQAFDLAPVSSKDAVARFQVR